MVYLDMSYGNKIKFLRDPERFGQLLKYCGIYMSKEDTRYISSVDFKLPRPAAFVLRIWIADVFYIHHISEPEKMNVDQN